MAEGFSVEETIELPPEDVWAYLTDVSHAPQWMTGVEKMTQLTQEPIQLGSHLRFKARGKERESQVTTWEPGKRFALTSTQGGITGTYTYTLAATEGGTKVTLNAVCRATGIWKLAHPIIVFRDEDE